MHAQNHQTDRASYDDTFSSDVGDVKEVAAPRSALRSAARIDASNATKLRPSRFGESSVATASGGTDALVT